MHSVSQHSVIYKALISTIRLRVILILIIIGYLSVLWSLFKAYENIQEQFLVNYLNLIKITSQLVTLRDRSMIFSLRALISSRLPGLINIFYQLISCKIKRTLHYTTKQLFYGIQYFANFFTSSLFFFILIINSF